MGSVDKKFPHYHAQRSFVRHEVDRSQTELVYTTNACKRGY